MQLSLETSTYIIPKHTSIPDIIAEDRPEAIRCVICFTNERRCVTFPCRHNIMCGTCTKILCKNVEPKCPECCMSIECYLEHY